MFPGAVNLAIIGYTCFPRLFRDILRKLFAVTHLPVQAHKGWIVVFIYAWLSTSMVVAYLAKTAEPHRFGRFISAVLVYIAGYGSLLCACTFTSYVKELRGAEMKLGQDGEDGEDGDPDVTAGPGQPPPGVSAPRPPEAFAPRPPEAFAPRLPEAFTREVSRAVRYERGLVVKAAAMLAVVAVIVILRALYFT